MLLEGREGVVNYFADPVVVKVQFFLKYEAEIVKEGDLARQNLERLKAEFMRLQTCRLVISHSLCWIISLELSIQYAFLSSWCPFLITTSDLEYSLAGDLLFMVGSPSFHVSIFCH
ncbi:hypothetical protein MKX03_017135 [Papaver bracteatum]|nr:hypothetical protein MKX03_017135 [Papaver bracteatum]